jgi:hypothetical protein
MRSDDERVADVRRLLAAAERVYADRAAFVPDIARTTGLTPEGVELGFGCLQSEAHVESDEDLDPLIARAGTTKHVHVVMSANVFVAPLRALAVARAAADRVTIRPSPRDPVLTEALVRYARDPALQIVDERDVAVLEATEIHVYGRDSTIADVRARARSGVTVRGHGAGMGIVVFTGQQSVDRAARSISLDVVLFDQRGCLSPRVVVAIGNPAEAGRLAEALHRHLEEWGQRVPRGELLPDERAESARWIDTMRFAGNLLMGSHHVVGVSPGPVLLVPPPGRHVLVVGSPTFAAARELLAPVIPFVVVVGSDDAGRGSVTPPGVRNANLGSMQRPPLDGPVDRRESWGT